MPRKQANNKMKQQRSRKGASAVEFAIVGPVMFLIIFACLELVRLGMMQGIAEDASYEAARFVMVPGATKAEGVTEANRLLSLLGTRNAVVTVEPYNSSGDIQSEIDDFTNRVTVRIDIPIRDNSLMASMYAGDRMVSSTATLTFESYEGYYDGGGS